MEFVVIAVLIGLIPATLAKNKGYSFASWWFYGAMLFIVALPHALVLKPNQTALAREQARAGMRRCPQCAEFIQQAAKVCRFCGLEQTDYVPPAPPTSENTGRPLKMGGKDRVIKATIGVPPEHSKTYARWQKAGYIKYDK